MYDWANSAFSTLSITILMFYITGVVVPDKTLGPVVWAWGIGTSMLIAAALSPILGAIADANASKRKWLAATALSGAGTAVLMAIVPPEQTWLIIGLFIVTCLCFELSLGFYNGFLPEIADEAAMNRVSAWGYALGYVGGALALVLVMGVTIFGEELGLPDPSDQLRVGILIMGLWWGLFTLPTVWVLRDRGQPPADRLPLYKAARQAAREVVQTLRNVRHYKYLSLFLLGFLFYNDGIQSVISQSGLFAKEELGFRFKEDLLPLFLMIQVVAFPGAILVGRLADRIGQKPTLMLCLGVWVAVVVTVFFVTTKEQFWILSIVLALVLGGTQSVSRAIMARMTPPGRTAEFFGFFNLSGKATSFLGTYLFALIVGITGSLRLAVLSLLIFFLIGWAIVSGINVEKGRQQAIEA